MNDDKIDDPEMQEADAARRRFLESCGKLALAAPPFILGMTAVAPKKATAAPSTFPGDGWGTDGPPGDGANGPPWKD